MSEGFVQIQKEQLKILKQTRMFTAFTEAEIPGLLDVLRAKIADYAKGSFIYREGQKGVSAAVVLTGSVHIIKEDFWGNRAILSEISAGEMFAETYACVPGEALAVSAAAAEDCSCIFFDFSGILSEQSCKAEAAGRRLLINLTQILAGKNLFLTKKIEHITQRSTRQKLLSYLSEVQRRAGSSVFDIPFDRQELADFLAVDRSAMSAELSRLRREGILEYHKNHFRLKNPEM